MNEKTWIILGAIGAGLAVVMGAFGAHGIDGWIDQQFESEAVKRKEYWETAARYQMYHSLGMIMFGLVQTFVRLSDQPSSKSTAQTKRRTDLTGWSMMLGILIFSGSLYLMATTQLRLGMVVPIGGVFFILGWISLAIDATKITIKN